MGRRTLVRTGGGASAVVALALALLVTGGCARVDLREGLPAATLAGPVSLSVADVVVAAEPLGELPPPPGLGGGLAGLLPDPLASSFAALPVVGALGAPAAPEWMPRARRTNVVTPALVEGLLGHQGRTWERSSRWYALSSESAALLDARRAGVAYLLVVTAAAGPDDGGAPLPGRVVVGADVSLLRTASGRTVARGYDRVSLPVRAPTVRALEHALRRCGRELGGRLARVMRLPAPAALPGDDEEEP